MKSRKKNFKKANDFVAILKDLHPYGVDAGQVKKLARKFLKTVGGSSIFILVFDAEKKKLFPGILEGSACDSVRDYIYSRPEGIEASGFLKDEAVILSSSDNFRENKLISDICNSLSIKSVMVAPFGAFHDAEGVIIVMDEPENPPYGEDSLDLLRAFSGVIGLIYRYTNIQRRLDSQSREMARKDFDLYTVYHVARVLSSILNIEELTGMLVDMLTEVLTVSHTVLFLMDEDEEGMTLTAEKYIETPGAGSPAFNHSQSSFKVTEKSADWLLARTFEGSIISNFDAKNFRLAFPGADRVFKDLRIKIAVPMIYRYQLVGFLGLGYKILNDDYKQHDYEFLSTIAPLAANAVSNAKLYEMAILDGLTRLFLGRYFQQRCKEELKRAARYKKEISFIMWDIDFFKKINDHYGHLVGDTVLRELAQLFKKSIRQEIDLVSRYGGEEFVMLLPDTSPEGAMLLAERLRQKVSEFPFSEGTIQLTISGGISSFPADGADYTALIHQADLRLYEAKRSGRNKVCSAAMKSKLNL